MLCLEGPNTVEGGTKDLCAQEVIDVWRMPRVRPHSPHVVLVSSFGGIYRVAHRNGRSNSSGAGDCGGGTSSRGRRPIISIVRMRADSRCPREVSMPRCSRIAGGPIASNRGSAYSFGGIYRG